MNTEGPEIKAVDIGSPLETISSSDIHNPMVIGIYFNVPIPVEQRIEYIRAWAEDFDPSVSLTVSLDAMCGCGGQAVYRTAEEIPLVDVPCPCGDPNHWLVKWSEERR